MMHRARQLVRNVLGRLPAPRRARWTNALISTIACAVALGTAPLAAVGAEGRLTVSELVVNPHSVASTGRFIRVDGATSPVAYCAQGWLVTPKVGQSLTRYGALGIPELDYVLYHGYDGKTVTSIYGLNETRSEAATTYAAWLSIADQREDVLSYTSPDEGTYHGNKGYLERWQNARDAQAKEAGWKLYQEGLAYKQAGGGGIEEGCAILWKNETPFGPNQTFDYQDLVTVEKRVTVRFTKISAQIELTADNPSYSPQGARYDIFRRDDGTKVASIETDENGSAQVALAPNTEYYAVETKAPAGYLLNDKRVEFTTGQGGTEVTLEDQPGTFRLAIVKKDAATNGPAQPGASLEGAEYKLVSESKPGFSAIGSTDKNGTLKFTGIPLGSVAVTETKAPEGYALDTSTHSFTVTAEDLGGDAHITLTPTEDFKEVPVCFDIEIMKFEGGAAGSQSTEKPLPGISFEIVSNTTGKAVGTITTGKDGYASTVGSWLGSGSRPSGASGSIPFDRKGYTVREVESTVPDGFKAVDPWTISADQITDGACLRYMVDNHRARARVQIVKVDAATQEPVALEGFAFQILDKEKRPLDSSAWANGWSGSDTFTTDASGSVTLPDRLKTGSYFLREVAANAPYLLNTEDLPFTISSKDDEALVTLKAADKRARGRARIEKRCEAGCDSLEGATFDVISLEDVVAPDGSIEAHAGEVVDTVETDDGGRATTRELPLGGGTARYAFRETRPPAGHTLNAEIIPFTLAYKDSSCAVVFAHATCVDTPNEIVIQKTIKGTDSPLGNATFHLWRAEDENAETGEGTPDLKGGCKAVQLVTDDSGTARHSHLEPGTWKLREAAAPAGYLVSPDTLEFEVADDGTIQGTGSFSVEVDDDFTRVAISKRDITDEQELEGARLTVLDKDGDVVEQWVSTTEPHLIERLAPGSYTLVEELEPRTYDKASSVTFTVEETRAVQHVAMYDRPLEISGSIDKRQEIGDPVGEDTTENGDGKNRAEVTASEEGLFDYAVDARNESETWVDELTVTDELDGVIGGLVILEGITTPQATGDFDGLLNVWYKTEPIGETVEHTAANATTDDGHVNPWLDDSTVLNGLGDDRRALDYSDWRLWAKGIDSTVATHLSVSDLGLEPGLTVSAIRLEYGRVDADFTTREGGWDREDLKHPHDDAEHLEEGQGDTAQGERDLAPALLHMRLTDRYRDGTPLENSARLDMFRNGGGQGLEDHDSDNVVQTPKTAYGILDQTGVKPLIIALVTGAAVAGALAIAAWKR